MKKLILLVSCLLLVATMQLKAQVKEVAVISVYADKQIEPGEFRMASALDKLAGDENFSMQNMINDFHKKFFEQFAPKFPFKLMPEDKVLNAEGYNESMLEKGLKLIAETPEGYDYVPILSRGVFKHKNGIINSFDVLGNPDAVMIAYISFSLKKETEIMGFGTAKVNAYVNIKMHDKEVNTLFKLKERAESDDKFKFALGGMFKPEDILPLCEQALKNLYKDMDKKLPKQIAKMEKKLAKLEAK